MSLHSYFGTVTQQSPRLHMDDLWAADQSAVGSGVMRRGAQHGSECFNRKRVLAQALELFLPCFDLCSSTTNRFCSETRWSLAASLNTPARKCPCLTRKLALLLQCWAALNFSALEKVAGLASVRAPAALGCGLRCTSPKSFLKVPSQPPLDAGSDRSSHASGQPRVWNESSGSSQHASKP